MKHLRTLCLSIILIYGSPLLAQGEGKGGIEMVFTQDSLQFDEEFGELTNVLKIINSSEEVITVFPKAKLPSDWHLIFALPEKLVLQPQSQKNFLTLDLAIPTSAAGGTHHRIDLSLHNELGQAIGTQSFHVFIPISRSWEAYCESNELFIPKEGKKTSFDIFVRNTGNVAEDLKIDFLTHPNLDIFKGPTKKISLAAGADTTLSYQIRYLEAPLTAQKLPLRFMLESSKTDYKVKGYIFFVLLDNEFDYLSTKGKNLSVELFAGNTGGNGALGAGLRANGQIDVKDNGRLAVDVNLPNLQGNLDAENRYLLQYQDELLEVEASNEYLSTEYRTAKDTESNWGVGLAQYHNSGMTQFSLNRQSIRNNRRLSTELEYFSDPNSKRQMATSQFVLDMPYRERDNLYFSVQHLHVRDRGDNAYISNAQQYLLRYEGRHSMQLNSSLDINYATPKFELAEAGLFQATGNLAFRSKSQRQEISLWGNYINKSAGNFAKGEQIASPKYQQSQFSLDYSVFLGAETVATFGSQYQSQIQDAPALAKTNSFPFQSSQWGWRFEARHKRAFTLSVNRSFSTLRSLTDSYAKESFSQGNWEVRSRFRHRFFSIDYQYQDAADIPTLPSDSLTLETAGHSLHMQVQKRNLYAGLKYQQLSEDSRLILPFMARGRLWANRVSYSVASNLIYQFGDQSTSLLGRAHIDWHVDKGWHLLLSGQMSKRQEQLSTQTTAVSQDLSTQFEVGIRKDMRVELQQDPAHHLKVLCFKDENGNGLWDPGEEPMPDIRLHLTQKERQSRSRSRVQEAAVFSNARGQAEFKHMPAGTYQVTIFRLGAANDNYFSTTAEAWEIELLTNQDLLLPFGKGQRIQGQVKLERDDYSALGELPINGIKITATNANGRVFHALTDKEGKFSLFVPYSESYNIQLRNPYEEHFEMKQGQVKVSLTPDTPVPPVELVLKEVSVEVEWN